MPSLNMSLLVRKTSPVGRGGGSPPSPSSSDQPTPSIYEAESPDELALVHAARAYDVRLVKRTPRSAIVALPDKSTLAFEILHVSSSDNSKLVEILLMLLTDKVFSLIGTAVRFQQEVHVDRSASSEYRGDRSLLQRSRFHDLVVVVDLRRGRNVGHENQTAAQLVRSPGSSNSRHGEAIFAPSRVGNLEAETRRSGIGDGESRA